MNIEPISAIINRALKALYNTSKEEWPAIYDSLNSWEWNEWLGDKPSDWDNIKNYSIRKFLCFLIYGEDRRTRTKRKIIEPIMQKIESTIGRKAILRYHHIHNLQRTDQQFEDWWDSEGNKLLTS